MKRGFWAKYKKLPRGKKVEIATAIKLSNGAFEIRTKTQHNDTQELVCYRRHNTQFKPKYASLLSPETRKL